MEPATTGRGPVATVRLGVGETQCRGGWRAWARRAGPVALAVAVPASFAGAVYRARHSARNLAFVTVTYYLLALLLCCVSKLQQLRLDPAAGDQAERRRVRLAVWAVTVALANTVAWRVADAMPSLALKLAVWGITVAALAIACYFIFRRRDGECCSNIAELGHGHQSGAGRRPEMAFPGLAAEDKV